MILADVLPKDLVCMPLTATDKYSAITELVDLMAAKGRADRRDELLGAVMEREAQRTTGIGRGFAVPHAKTDAVRKMVIALGKTSEPIDFESIDGKPVSLIALLASPANSTQEHMQALTTLSRLIMNEQAYQGLVDAPDAESLYHIAVESANGR